MTNDLPKKKTKASLLDNKLDNNPEETCPWHINSPKHYNCLWIYIIDKSSLDGSMPEMVQTEIANFLGWSNTKTHFALKEAMTELIDALNKNKAKQLINKDPDHIVDISLLDIDVVPNSIPDGIEE